MLEATRSKSLKVLGFLSLDNQLKSYTTTGTIDSPELNRIEILWRFMKYHWIEIKDYASTQTLEDYVHWVLSNYGMPDGVEINFG